MTTGISLIIALAFSLVTAAIVFIIVYEHSLPRFPERKTPLKKALAAALLAVILCLLILSIIFSVYIPSFTDLPSTSEQSNHDGSDF